MAAPSCTEKWPSANLGRRVTSVFSDSVTPSRRKVCGCASQPACASAASIRSRVVRRALTRNIGGVDALFSARIASVCSGQSCASASISQCGCALRVSTSRSSRALIESRSRNQRRSTAFASFAKPPRPSARVASTVVATAACGGNRRVSSCTRPSTSSACSAGSRLRSGCCSNPSSALSKRTHQRAPSLHNAVRSARSRASGSFACAGRSCSRRELPRSATAASTSAASARVSVMPCAGRCARSSNRRCLARVRLHVAISESAIHLRRRRCRCRVWMR